MTEDTIREGAIDAVRNEVTSVVVMHGESETVVRTVWGKDAPFPSHAAARHISASIRTTINAHEAKRCGCVMFGTLDAETIIIGLPDNKGEFIGFLLKMVADKFPGSVVSACVTGESCYLTID